MTWLVLGIGLVLCLEGLVFALAPDRLDDMAKMLADMPRDTRRSIGLIALGLGVALVWLARLLGL